MLLNEINEYENNVGIYVMFIKVLGRDEFIRVSFMILLFCRKGDIFLIFYIMSLLLWSFRGLFLLLFNRFNKFLLF